MSSGNNNTAKERSKGTSQTPNYLEHNAIKNIMTNTLNVKQIAREIIKYAQNRFNVHVSIPLSCKGCLDCIFITDGKDGLGVKTAKDLLIEKGTKKKTPVNTLPPASAIATSGQSPLSLAVSATEPIDENTKVKDVNYKTVSRETHTDKLKKMVIQSQEKRCHVVKRTGKDCEYKGLSTTKGTQSYNKAKKEEYQKQVETVLEKQGTQLFVTVTANRVDETQTLKNTWQLFIKSLKALINRLSVDYKATYFYAIETDMDMLPHAHIVTTLTECTKGNTKGNKETESQDYKDIFTQWLSKYWKMGTISVKRVKDIDTAQNIACYVTKELQQNLESIYKNVKYKGLEMTEYEKRATNTMYWTSNLKCRQFMYSREKGQKPKGEKVQTIDAQRTQAEVINTVLDDFQVIRQANESGIYDDNTDKAFYRLLGTFIPREKAPKWFLMSQKDKEAQCLQRNGNLCQQVHNRMNTFAQQCMRGACDITELFDREINKGGNK